MRAFVFSLCILACQPVSVSRAAELVDAIQAVVHDSVVTTHQVRELMVPQVQLLRTRYANQPDTFANEFNKVMEDNIDQLVERQMILHEFQTAGYNLPESVIDEAIKQRIKDQYGDRRTLTKTLQSRGQTWEGFRRQIREQFIVEAMTAQNVPSQPFVSPYQMRVYYNAHKEDYRVEEQVKLSMIVLNKAWELDDKPKRLAQELVVKLKAGDSFGDLAATYSQGSQSSERGDWGWVERSVLREELADVAFSLKPGEVSDPIETKQAVYIMRVDDHKPAHYTPIDEVRAEIEKTVRLEEKDKLRKKWMEKLKKSTFVRYF